jgi:hypothetical protein
MSRPASAHHTPTYSVAQRNVAVWNLFDNVDKHAKEVITDY